MDESQFGKALVKSSIPRAATDEKLPSYPLIGDVLSHGPCDDSETR